MVLVLALALLPLLLPVVVEGVEAGFEVVRTPPPVFLVALLWPLLVRVEKM